MSKWVYLKVDLGKNLILSDCLWAFQLLIYYIQMCQNLNEENFYLEN